MSLGGHTGKIDHQPGGMTVFLCQLRGLILVNRTVSQHMNRRRIAGSGDGDVLDQPFSCIFLLRLRSLARGFELHQNIIAAAHHRIGAVIRQEQFKAGHGGILVSENLAFDRGNRAFRILQGKIDRSGENSIGNINNYPVRAEQFIHGVRRNRITLDLA